MEFSEPLKSENDTRNSMKRTVPLLVQNGHAFCKPGFIAVFTRAYQRTYPVPVESNIATWLRAERPRNRRSIRGRNKDLHRVHTDSGFQGKAAGP
jgi:hypothetical protein